MASPGEPFNTASTPMDTKPTAPPAKDIPLLTSIGPSIFVPITSDLLAPIDPPATRVARLHAIIAEIDTHAALVRANMLALLARERTRIVADAQVQPPQPDLPRGAPPAAADAMIAAMEAPAPRDPRWSSTVANIPTPVFNSATARTPREKAVIEVMGLASQTIRDVDGFDEHVKRRRQFYEKALEKELEDEAA